LVVKQYVPKDTASFQLEHLFKINAAPEVDMPSITQKKGTGAERYAASWLKKRGYTILDMNYRFQKIEIDLIALDESASPYRQGEIVFVEVKWRQTDCFALPIVAVTPSKQRRLIQGAKVYIAEHRLSHLNCRFDVICLTGVPPMVTLDHFEGAFRDA